MEVIKIETSQIEKSHSKHIDNKTNIYYDIFKRKDIGQEKLEELIREMKGGDEDMLACVEMIREENKKIREEGIKEGKTQGIAQGIAQGIREERKIIINSMLKKGMSIKEIQEITKATKKEIEGAKEKDK